MVTDSVGGPNTPALSEKGGTKRLVEDRYEECFVLTLESVPLIVRVPRMTMAGGGAHDLETGRLRCDYRQGQGRTAENQGSKEM